MSQEIINILLEDIIEHVDIIIEEIIQDVSIEVSEIGVQGPPGIQGPPGPSLVNLIMTSGESIPSHTPVVIHNNLAYKLDASNPSHQFAFVGFSINGTSINQSCEIQQLGKITLIGWGLIPNQHYLAGINGTLITENLSNSNFTKVIGYATDSNTLQIIKDSITINKN